MPATNRQEGFLQRLKLPIPTDFTAASRLLDYALNGTDSRGQTAKARRAMIRRYWDNWVGHYVQIVQVGHRWHGHFGTVEYLQARTEQEVADVKAAHRARNPLPFFAVIALDSPRAQLEIHLTGIKHVNIIQTRLF